MSVPRPVLDEPARAALEAIAHPVTIGSAVRDRDGQLVDFRLDFANAAAVAWSGLPGERVLGRFALELLPALRTTGLFDELAAVVRSGTPFLRADLAFEAEVRDGNIVSGRYDLAAMRLGDGYLSVWAQLGDGGSRSEQLEASLRGAHAKIRLVRLEFAPLARRLLPSLTA